MPPVPRRTESGRIAGLKFISHSISRGSGRKSDPVVLRRGVWALVAGSSSYAHGGDVSPRGLSPLHLGWITPSLGDKAC